MLNPDDPNVRMAADGKAIENFKESFVGQLLYSEAEKMASDAMYELKNVDAFKPEEILKSQNRIKVAELIISWLETKIVEGREAMEELRNAQN